MIHGEYSQSETKATLKRAANGSAGQITPASFDERGIPTDYPARSDSADHRLARISGEVTPLVIAHRGASLREPENTLRALEEAIRCGADLRSNSTFSPPATVTFVIVT